MLKGIDVSHFTNLTPQILDSIVKNQGLYFDYIKSSTGANGKDAKFVQNWSTSRNAGLLCGAYHWLWPLTDPTQQANNFIAQFKLVNRAGVLPPAVDIEWTWNASDQQTTANELWGKITQPQRVALIKEFLTKVEAALNVKPVIYTAYAFWTSLISGNPDDNDFFSAYPLWIADPSGNNKVPPPWATAMATFTQTHFGEKATTKDPYDLMDQDAYNGPLAGLLNLALPGLVFMKGFPCSQIVKDLQDALISKGALAGPSDGYFGNNTATAVTKFQTDNGLTGNGVIDAQTWSKLLV